MDTSLFIRNDDGLVDTWRARDIALGHIWYWEQETVLGQAYQHWRNLASDELDRLRAPIYEEPFPVPRVRSFNPATQSYFYVDTSSDNPSDFRLITPSGAGYGIRVDDINVKILRRMLTVDMSIVKNTGKPSYQQIYQSVGGAVHEYYRILLPISGDKNNLITKIYSFARPLALAKIPEVFSWGK